MTILPQLPRTLTLIMLVVYECILMKIRFLNSWVPKSAIM